MLHMCEMASWLGYKVANVKLSQHPWVNIEIHLYFSVAFENTQMFCIE